jgi:protein subunit release factor A
MNTIISIQSAEGGDDAKMLIQDMLSIYKKACNVHSFSVTGVQ